MWPVYELEPYKYYLNGDTYGAYAALFNFLDAIRKIRPPAFKTSIINMQHGDWISTPEIDSKSALSCPYFHVGNVKKFYDTF